MTTKYSIEWAASIGNSAEGAALGILAPAVINPLRLSTVKPLAQSSKQIAALVHIYRDGLHPPEARGRHNGYARQRTKQKRLT
jgi:hypothetical protein